MAVGVAIPRRRRWRRPLLARLLRLPVCPACDRRVVVTVVGAEPRCARCAGRGAAPGPP